jgi:hypothetical protein
VGSTSERLLTALKKLNQEETAEVAAMVLTIHIQISNAD